MRERGGGGGGGERERERPEIGWPQCHRPGGTQDDPWTKTQISTEPNKKKRIYYT